MKDLLLNTGRAGDYGDSRRFRFKHTDPDLLPRRLSGTEFIGWRRSSGDRLSPLYSFLETNCGRPWSKVYAEICKVADHRSLRGFHLLQHVEQYVVPNNYDVGHRRSYGPFFVDVDGTLQKERKLTEAERQANYLVNAKRFKWKIQPPEVPNPKLIDTKDHWWEKIEGIWYEFTRLHIKDTRIAEEFLIDRGNNVVDIGRTIEAVLRERIAKRQVDSKTVRKLEARLSKAA